MQPQPPRPASEATLTPFIGNGTLLERKGTISCRTSSRFMMYEKKSLHGLRGRCRGLEARLYWQTSALLSLEERRCDDRHPRLRLLTRSKKSRRAGRPRVGPRPLTYLVVLQWFCLHCSQEFVRVLHLQPTVFRAQRASLLPGIGLQTDAVLLPQRISRQESTRDPY